MTFATATSLGGGFFGSKSTAPTLTFGTPAITSSAFSFGTPKTTGTTGLCTMKL